MTKGQQTLLALWSLAMAGSLSVYFQEDESAAASEIVGILDEKTGQVEYRSPNFSVWTSARKNQGFEKGTFVSTAKGSAAKISFGSQHVIDLAEDSQIVVGNPDELAARSSFFVGVLKGNLKVESVPTALHEQRQNFFSLFAVGHLRNIRRWVSATYFPSKQRIKLQMAPLQQRKSVTP